ncbi:dTDP-4-amino-4,6-dideoxygalactose transaminase [Anaerocolumna jejuensis]|uniref:dTDP-4-amino-4,6-dideoxygalactose transaminase n=1 Tax=Anaerocolumna jejuensis TaxID=259063 RepID=UPI003F7C0AE3
MDKRLIPFNVPPFTGKEIEYVTQAINSHKICGDGEFTKKCAFWLEERTGSSRVLMTTSCTHATEMAALLCDIKPGDEVIMPSYTFVSTANAFVLRGAKAVFVDIRPDTMNIDEKLIENAITKKTKAIVPMHYAGISCEMDTIMDIANRHSLLVIEDAAQGVMSSYKGKALGTIGDYGCYSFHETKNYSMGEGGALLIKNADMIEEAEVIREKGTNRSKFFRGQIDKYTWVNYGSSYLPSELNAAYLYAELEKADEINENRLDAWNRYYNGLSILEDRGYIELPTVPEVCVHNAHMFYIKTKDLEERTSLITYLKENGVNAVFHYIPLHSSPAGHRLGRFVGEDKFTTKESERLLRLPLYYGLKKEDQENVIDVIYAFYRNIRK